MDLFGLMRFLIFLYCQSNHNHWQNLCDGLVIPAKNSSYVTRRSMPMLLHVWYWRMCKGMFLKYFKLISILCCTGLFSGFSKSQGFFPILKAKSRHNSRTFPHNSRIFHHKANFFVKKT